MRRRYVLAIVLVTALIFSLAGFGVGYGVWHEGEANASVVTYKNADYNAEYNDTDYCIGYVAGGQPLSICFNDLHDPPDCFTQAKIGGSLPGPCR